MNTNINYGQCDKCGENLQVTEWYDEYERDNEGHFTGRKRRAVSSLFCPNCFKKFCIDDTFDKDWHY